MAQVDALPTSGSDFSSYSYPQIPGAPPMVSRMLYGAGVDISRHMAPENGDSIYQHQLQRLRSFQMMNMQQAALQAPAFRQMGINPHSQVGRTLAAGMMDPNSMASAMMAPILGGRPGLAQQITYAGLTGQARANLGLSGPAISAQATQATQNALYSNFYVQQDRGAALKAKEDDYQRRYGAQGQFNPYADRDRSAVQAWDKSRSTYRELEASTNFISTSGNSLSQRFGERGKRENQRENHGANKSLNQLDKVDASIKKIIDNSSDDVKRRVYTLNGIDMAAVREETAAGSFGSDTAKMRQYSDTRTHRVDQAKHDVLQMSLSKIKGTDAERALRSTHMDSNGRILSGHLEAFDRDLKVAMGKMAETRKKQAKKELDDAKNGVGLNTSTGVINYENTRGFKLEDFTSGLANAARFNLIGKHGSEASAMNAFSKHGGAAMGAARDIFGNKSGGELVKDINSLLGSSSADLGTAEGAGKVEKLLQNMRVASRAAGTSIDAVMGIVKEAQALAASRGDLMNMGGVATTQIALKALHSTVGTGKTFSSEAMRRAGGSAQVASDKVKLDLQVAASDVGKNMTVAFDHLQSMMKDKDPAVRKRAEAAMKELKEGKINSNTGLAKLFNDHGFGGDTDLFNSENAAKAAQTNDEASLFAASQNRVLMAGAFSGTPEVMEGLNEYFKNTEAGKHDLKDAKLHLRSKGIHQSIIDRLDDWAPELMGTGKGSMAYLNNADVRADTDRATAWQEKEQQQQALLEKNYSHLYGGGAERAAQAVLRGEGLSGAAVSVLGRKTKGPLSESEKAFVDKFNTDYDKTNNLTVAGLMKRRLNDPSYGKEGKDLAGLFDQDGLDSYEKMRQDVSAAGVNSYAELQEYGKGLKGEEAERFKKFQKQAEALGADKDFSILQRGLQKTDVFGLEQKLTRGRVTAEDRKLNEDLRTQQVNDLLGGANPNEQDQDIAAAYNSLSKDELSKFNSLLSQDPADLNEADKQSLEDLKYKANFHGAGRNITDAQKKTLRSLESVNQQADAANATLTEAGTAAAANGGAASDPMTAALESMARSLNISGLIAVLGNIATGLGVTPTQGGG